MIDKTKIFISYFTLTYFSPYVKKNVVKEAKKIREISLCKGKIILENTENIVTVFSSIFLSFDTQQKNDFVVGLKKQRR